MTDVLLTHGYFLFEDEKEREIMKPYPPLGLLYVSAYLKRAGHRVEVFDSTFESPSGLYARLEQNPGILGVYTNLITRTVVLDIVAAARNCGWTVVLGGPESANYPSEYLRHGANVVVLGEGEETMHHVIGALSASGGSADLKAVAGIVFTDEDGVVHETPPRAQIRDIDALPWPDRDAVDIGAYVRTWREHHQAGSVNMITARGCPYRCRWCSHAVFGFTHRRRDHVDCAAELEHLVERYAPDQVWYADDVFTIHHRWLYRYAEELRRRRLHVPFETISRADRLMDERVLDTLAEMGCWRIWIGSESGSQSVLDAMDRGVTVEQVQWATHAAQKVGIQVGMFLMWGYEGETVQDIAATVEHVMAANPDEFFTTVAYPIKNTAYFEAVADRVTLDGAWRDSTDRDYAIAGRPDREYYHHADRWLRHAVAARRLESTDPVGAAREQRSADEARRALVARS